MHDEPAHLGLPVGAGGRRIDLPDDDIDDPIEDVVLVLDMVVERHRVDTELLAELAHADRLAAAPIGEFDGCPEDALLAQRDARSGIRTSLGHHLELLMSSL